MNWRRSRIFRLVIFILLAILFMSCSSSSSGGGDGILSGDDLTKDISNFVPDSILTKINDLGMPIHKGSSPPVFEGMYLSSPFTLVSTNRPNDVLKPGDAIADYTVRFYEQSNDSLKVKIDYQNGPESGTGIGGHIVGKSDQFTVFAELDMNSQGHKAKSLVVYSGKITSNSIVDFYITILMLDNFDNPGGIWINNGDGRLFYDKDGNSPMVSGFSKLLNQPSVGSASALR